MILYLTYAIFAIGLFLALIPEDKREPTRSSSWLRFFPLAHIVVLMFNPDHG